jgi:RecB family exonuclease
VIDAGAPWFSQRERARVERMLRSFQTWLRGSRTELTQVAVEQKLDVEPERRAGGPGIKLTGRVDRLERDAQGRPVIVDIKTGKTAASAADAEEHPQLAVYQLAAALGAFAELGLDTEPGGARLLYLASSKTGATERVQPALDNEAVQTWLDVVHSAAAACVGPAYTATENSDCDRCPAKVTCPVHDSGRQVPG